MALSPALLIVPSLCAAIEIPRRLAAGGRALAGLYPYKAMELARAIAEPALLGHGLRAWDTGHDALIAAKLLSGAHGLRLSSSVPPRIVARVLARTLQALRRAGIAPERLQLLAAEATNEADRERLSALAGLHRAAIAEIEGRFADPVTLLRTARERLRDTPWLTDATALVVGDPELDPLERAFIADLARVVPVTVVGEGLPPTIGVGSIQTWAATEGLCVARPSDTLLASEPVAPTPAGLRRLRERLFEPPTGEPVDDASVELLTAPGEAAEVRAITRRLLHAAANGVPFEEMGVALPRPDVYAPLFTDLLTRVGIPHKLHPSLPLRFGRAARSLLLLLRCRDLGRTQVMEFLTFAPLADGMTDGSKPPLARWDALSRDARIVSGFDRWKIGLGAYADEERAGAARERNEERRRVRAERVADADALLRIVQSLNDTLDGLTGEASWREWSERLRQVVDQWIAVEGGRGDAGTDRDEVVKVIAELAGLQDLAARVPWADVESVIESRFEWERVPLASVRTGAVHVGALDAIAGLGFRVFAIPGLVESGFPGVFRPDPLLLDEERIALETSPAPAAVTRRAASAKRQLSLFDEPQPEPAAAVQSLPSLTTAQDALRESRRLFHRAVSQAREKLVLSYPRADGRTGRERLPSLFFAAAAQALAGRVLTGAQLLATAQEDSAPALQNALDAAERDLQRVREGGRDAALQIAAGSPFFRQSHLASSARGSSDLTAYDGLVAFSPKDGDPELAQLLRERLDPLRAPSPASASGLALYARCGFQYFLERVLHLEPTLEPEERRRLDPLERGSAFHEVAERFLRELRDNGLLPLRGDEKERRLLLQFADEELSRVVAGSPPRFTLLWERESRRFRATLLQWLSREAAQAERSTPAYLEVGFGMAGAGAPGEPHRAEPLTIDLGDGRALRVQGKIDRIDKKSDGSLVLRDYKTGRAPIRDDVGFFRGGKQLQVPFYILAAAEMFPGQPVVEAFLDYVDGGRQVAVNTTMVTSDSFRQVLRGLVDAIAGGIFVQDPSACDFCEFTAVCGPKQLLAYRRDHKSRDPRVVRAQQLKALG